MMKKGRGESCDDDTETVYLWSCWSNWEPTSHICAGESVDRGREVVASKGSDGGDSILRPSHHIHTSYLSGDKLRNSLRAPHR